MKEWRCVNGIDKETMSLTMFLANASAKYCPPKASI